MNNFIFVGVFIVVMACTPFALLAKENGTEECDAALKEVLAQAKQVTASAVFLREILPILNETKKVVEDLVVEQGKELARTSQDIAEMDRKEYDEAVRRYFGRNSRP